jgi:hypothetical protein
LSFWSFHVIVDTILPLTPDGKMLHEDSLLKPVSFGQMVCVQRSSTVGVKGMPFKEKA